MSTNHLELYYYGRLGEFFVDGIHLQLTNELVVEREGLAFVSDHKPYWFEHDESMGMRLCFRWAVLV